MKTSSYKPLVVALCISVIVLTCSNPFFPKTGMPLQTDSGRTTPVGVIDQLYRSYKTQQLSLFMDLFSSARDFRFYVSPAFNDQFKNTQHYPLGNIETIDTAFSYAYDHSSGKQAYYWSYDDEIENHAGMFTKAISITFTEDPQPIDTSAIRYFTGPEGVEFAEVVVTGGKIQIRARTDRDNVVDDYNLQIGVQVFYLEKDPANQKLWVIAKWFDLGTASSEITGY